MDAWTVLGIDETSDRKAVKKAYSVLLKKTRPEADPEAYQRLREAFDWAQDYCKHIAQTPETADTLETTASDSASTLELSNANPSLNDLDETALHPGNTEEHRAALDDRDSDTSQATDKEQLNKEQLIYETALAAAKRVFNLDSEAQSIAAFDDLFHGDELLHLVTRTYFENICLSALIEFSADRLPYDLTMHIAQAFHWFDERHNNHEKAKQIHYLNARVDAYTAYKNVLVARAVAGVLGEKSSAKLLISKYRPLYFHVQRFIGHNNRNIKKLIRYFEPIVEQELYPEILTETYVWWRKNLPRCLFSLPHIFVAFVLVVIFGVVLQSQERLPSIPADFIPYALIVTVLLVAVGVWGIHALQAYLYPRVQNLWAPLKEKRLTSIILSSIFVLSMFFYRYFSDIEYITYLWLPAIAALVLLYGMGSLNVLLHVTIFYIAYIVFDPLGKYVEVSYAAEILGFISHRIFVASLAYLPGRAEDYLFSSRGYYWLYSIVLSTCISVIYLYIAI